MNHVPFQLDVPYNVHLQLKSSVGFYLIYCLKDALYFGTFYSNVYLTAVAHSQLKKHTTYIYLREEKLV
jgi:hypothetical protein